VDLPRALHSRLYLLTYDGDRRRFVFHRADHRWLFGLALRAAMLTDLYLSGYLQDREGKACPTGVARPDDLLLCEALTAAVGQAWAKSIGHGERRARRDVREQLLAVGWLSEHQRRMFGAAPTTRLRLHDEGMVNGLADEVTTALSDAIDGRPSDPQALALGLLAFLAQMPIVCPFADDPHLRSELRDMICAAIEPILGLDQAIQRCYADMRLDMIHGQW
jgi:hypothetical protein